MTSSSLPAHRHEEIQNRAREALALTSDWIQRFGGRLAGTDTCRQAAAEICRELGGELEPFETHPLAFNKYYQVDAMVYLAGLILLIAGYPLIAALILQVIIVTAFLEFGWYREVYDPFYPRKTCHNVTAVLEPRGEARRTLIFSGHHDSAFELAFLRRHQKLYGLKIVIPDATRMLALVTAWVWTFWQVVFSTRPVFITPVLVLLVLGIYPVFTKFFLMGPQATPGAGDNLIASAMLVGLKRQLEDTQQNGRSRLAHTRLIFASFDAEESGLRGSRAWVKAHRADLAALPAYGLNIDSIYRAEDLQVLLSDLNNLIRLDEDLAARCIRIANERGWTLRTAVMRFGGGATDATELSRAGVHATTLIGMSAGIVRDGLVYHTMQDTVHAIEPAAVEGCLAIAEGLALSLDREGEDPTPG
jgi:aminopeptidase YwaD